MPEHIQTVDKQAVIRLKAKAYLDSITSDSLRKLYELLNTLSEQKERTIEDLELALLNTLNREYN